MSSLSYLKNSAYLLIFVFAILLLQSCLGIKPGSIKSGKKLFETFYVGDEGTQYFIKPLYLIANDKSEMYIDFTFRYKNEVKDSAIVTFSIVDKIMYKNIESINAKNATLKFIINKPYLLFVEKSGKDFKSRYSFKISLKELLSFYSNENWIIEIENTGIKKEFYTSKKTKKKILKLNEIVFSLFS